MGTHSVNWEDIDRVLPQTQCQSCGYKDCQSYAVAIARQSEKINRCAPGGNKVIEKLAMLMHRPLEEIAVDIRKSEPDTTAVINEEFCIGCALCISACPIDAIVGAPKRMHSVLNSICSGCGLCIPPCPTDCIELISLDAAIAKGKVATEKLISKSQSERSDLWKDRYDKKNVRRKKQAVELNKKAKSSPTSSRRTSDQTMRQDRVKKAMQVALQKLNIHR
jgi:electron transport complex protein RnfB